MYLFNDGFHWTIILYIHVSEIQISIYGVKKVVFILYKKIKYVFCLVYCSSGNLGNLNRATYRLVTIPKCPNIEFYAVK